MHAAPSTNASRGGADWSKRCTYQGPYREAVLRSLITLKALTYEPTGGIVAAPTTSLPEKLGGVRNWDYRFCWLRDATLSLLALLNCGYTDEAGAWRRWLLRAVAGDPSRTQIMYGLAGERRLPEWEVPWLAGYEGSKPVRVGNGAHDQRQLDVYGEIADALFQARKAGLAPLDDGWRVMRKLMQWLGEHWREPDEGIWEVRGPRQQFVHSKVLAWVAFDRSVKAVELFGRDGPELEEWKAARDEIHREVCTKGFDSKRNTFTQYYGSKALDASTLVIPLVGFLPADDPRVVGTTEAIGKCPEERRLHRPLRHRRDRGRTAAGGGGVPTLHVLVCRQPGLAGAARRGSRGLRTTARARATTSAC